MSSTVEALFNNKSSIERKEAREGFSISYQINYTELNFGKELGRGGFGVVHQGTWRKHTEVAIKQLLSDDISPEANEEFDTESQVMARLRSPHIVQFYGYCLNPRHCIVMEYMPNGSLYSVLKNKKQSLDWTIRIRIAIDIASGLAFLHQEHILHRDIKSLNVLLDQSYRAKLTDFGLSKIKTETQSQSMAKETNKDAVGTVAWMAPELFERRGIYTQKSDIYSLGITFWELASRKIPFSDASNPSLIPSWVSKGEREDIPKDCPPKLASLIAVCWEALPDKRPDADTVVTYLKSDKTDFAQFLTSFAVHQRKSTATHQANVNNLQAAPPICVQRPNPPEQKNPPAVLNQFTQDKPSSPRVNAGDLKTFLKLVAEGEQDKAEIMLKRDPALSVASGDVTDLSKRTFTGITGFQYAVWALDCHMWTMIRKYLPDEAAREQAQGFETGAWVKKHGVYANLNILIQAYKTTINLYNSLKWNEGNIAWTKRIGGAQSLLPAHVVNEYCHPTRPFYPTPDFKNALHLPRSRAIEEGEWFTAMYKGGYLGDKFAVYRGSQARGRACDRKDAGNSGGWGMVINALGRVVGPYMADVDLTVAGDYRSICVLANVRTAQRERLATELMRMSAPPSLMRMVSSRSQPEIGLGLAPINNFQATSPVGMHVSKPNPPERVSIGDLHAFLRLVVEGEQDKAEVMLKGDPALAFLSGDVTDLSNRTFIGITGFQYAVWALDWHMWKMIRKYLPDEVAQEQAQGFETGDWVKKHGVDAQHLLQKLVKVLLAAIDLYKTSESEGDVAWIQQVGGLQLLLPAHVINEYCHPTRPFYPPPNFNDALAFPRCRIIDKGEWFTASYKGGKLGDKFAVYRATQGVSRALERGWGNVIIQLGMHDCDSIRALTDIRTKQREALIIELGLDNKKPNINSAYQYEDNDIQAILVARLQQLRAQTPLLFIRRIEILAAVDNIVDLQLESRLKEEAKNHQGGRILIIPCNLGNAHWVGVLLTFKPNGQVSRAEYIDPLTTHPAVPEIFQIQLQKVYPRVRFEPRTILRQDDYTSCGAYTIENLLIAALGILAPETNAIRHLHLETLRQYNPAFYHAFNERQRNNRPTTVSLQEQLGYLDRLKGIWFSKPELSRILAIKQCLFRLPAEIQAALLRAFKPDPAHVDEHDLHLNNIRIALQEVLLLESKSVAELMELLFENWQPGNPLNLDKLNFRLSYNEILAVTESHLLSEQISNLQKIIVEQIKQDEEFALELQSKLWKESALRASIHLPDNSAQNRVVTPDRQADTSFTVCAEPLVFLQTNHTSSGGQFSGTLAEEKQLHGLREKAKPAFRGSTGDSL
jgi:serine/threonine protein kinase